MMMKDIKCSLNMLSYNQKGMFDDMEQICRDYNRIIGEMDVNRILRKEEELFEKLRIQKMEMDIMELKGYF